MPRPTVPSMLRLLVVLTLAAALSGLPANAMDFSLLRTGSGQSEILASGEIVPGDAPRLARALRRATPDAHGTRKLLLDSPGGSVVDALDMADLIGKIGVTTVVPAKAMCASACASVLFVAGRYRTVETGGQLLIHSCFDARSGRKMDQCDAYISARAQQQGISGRAMMAFQEMAPRTAIRRPVQRRRRRLLRPHPRAGQGRAGGQRTMPQGRAPWWSQEDEK